MRSRVEGVVSAVAGDIMSIACSAVRFQKRGRGTAAVLREAAARVEGAPGGRICGRGNFAGKAQAFLLRGANARNRREE